MGITGTYVLSGLMLILTGALFNNAVLTANRLTLPRFIEFFFASAGERGLLDGQRDLPDRDTCDCDRLLLSGRHRTRRHHRTGLLGKFISQGRDQLVFGYYIGAG